MLIRFLPDRLNVEPVVFRGFTTSEMGLTALAGLVMGVIGSLFFVPLLGWIMIPTGMLITPLVLIWFGGAWISRIKRGKPEHYLWQRLEERQCRLGLGNSRLIVASQGWSLKRNRGGKQ